MSEYTVGLLERIHLARNRAVTFLSSLKSEKGYKYTAAHDIDKYPAATLYGTWSVVLGSQLLGRLLEWSASEKEWAKDRLLDHYRENRTFLGIGLEQSRNSKSLEYLTLHCTNYAHGAILSLDPGFDFSTPYLHRFLDGDVLANWMDGRSFLRPWEEGNNIVNVASYLALCNDHGETRALARLEQMLEWHRKYQNPKTAGFDAFPAVSQKNMIQALGGAVHNFHIHLYLEERFGYENIIAKWLPSLLMQGMLTSCLSIDFVELAIRVIEHAPNPQELVWALIHHAEALLDSQRSDGGWIENDREVPSGGAGFKDDVISSISYGTWFRMCSLGMIAIVLLNDSRENWGFRNTLGMGYAPGYWPRLQDGIKVERPPLNWIADQTIKNFPNRAKTVAIRFGARLLQK